jgi:hypothetical protein
MSGTFGSHHVNRWKSYFSQLLNGYNVSDVRQIEIHTGEPLVPSPSHLEFEIAFAKLKNYKSPGNDLIPAQLIQAGDETLMSMIHNVINSIWNKEDLPGQWTESVIVPVHKKGDKTDCNNYRGISLLSTSYEILSNVVLSRLSSYMLKVIGDHQCGFNCNRSTTDQIFCIHRVLEKSGNTIRQYISYSFISRKPMMQCGGKYCTTFL